ncbi:MAG: hypothetical protein ACRD4S_03865 [Candidatus Acidiferrales bacterium]
MNNNAKIADNIQENGAYATALPALGGIQGLATDREAAKAGRLTEFLRRIVSFPAMLGALLVGGTFASVRAFILDPDVWWHIKDGDTILATHHWPTTDPYSFTVFAQPWLAYEWLGDVVMSTAHRIGGLRGLDALLIVVGSAVMIALYCLGTLRSGNSKAGFAAAVILLLLARPSFSMRPQMLGYLFLILTLIALERFRQGKPRALWFLPLLFLAWINTHGSWEIGLGTILLYWLSGLVGFQVGGIEAKRWTPNERKTIGFIFMLSVAATALTPYGTELAAVPFRIASSVPLSLKYVMEWQSMPFGMFGAKIFLGLILAFIACQVAFRFTWRIEELALFLGGTALACLHVRFLLVFVPFFTPLLAVILARWMSRYDGAKDLYAINAVLMAIVIVSCVHYFPSTARLEQEVEKSFPVHAVAYLNAHPVPSPMFNEYGLGGYLVWARGPEHKVFVDGRSELYEWGGALGDYFHITYLEPGALQVMKAYGIQSCLLLRAQPLATMLSASPEWQRVYSDNLTALYVRRDSRNQIVPVADKSSLPLLQRKGI